MYKDNIKEIKFTHKALNRIGIPRHKNGNRLGLRKRMQILKTLGNKVYQF